MKDTTIINDNFLLRSDLAVELYEDYAKNLPIIDYHSHLPPLEIAENKKFKNITEIWLYGDHYKWRAMRMLGVDEAFITGNASDFEKFKKWAEVVPYTLRNPLFHWTHMELKNPFGINTYLNTDSAEEIYHQASRKLQQDSFSTQGLLSHFKVEMVGTTDDPTDNLEAHIQLANSSFETKILPSFRPDKALQIGAGEDFRQYINKLSQVSQITITDLASLEDALYNRIDYFHQHGCRISDHGLQNIPHKGLDIDLINFILRRVLEGDDSNISEEIKNAFSFHILTHCAKKYHQLGWVQQYHLGAIRNNNKRLLSKLGPDTGFDSIGDYQQAEALSAYLNYLDSTDQLAKTVIYNLNPADNAIFGTMIGNFQGEGIKGKVQYGSAWWFLDQLDGMKQQIDALSNLGVLSCFIGMLTDSRSFLSYPRHEYFRRLLCNIFAEDMQNGLVPNDKKWVGNIISDISYYNAKNYFNL